MGKIRIFLGILDMFLIIIMLVLLAYIVFGIFKQHETFTCVGEESLTKLDDHGIVTFKIYNTESRDLYYPYTVMVNNASVTSQTVFIKSNSFFEYGGRIPTREGTNITILIYRGNETKPIKEIHHYT